MHLSNRKAQVSHAENLVHKRACDRFNCRSHPGLLFGNVPHFTFYLMDIYALCRIKITVTAVTVIKTWRLPVTVRVVTCGFSLINAYMCVVANVYWVMTYVTLTVIFLYDILVLRNDTKLKETFVSR